MGEVVDTMNRVLVGRVRGRTYYVACLHLWVMEIWGNFLKELPTIMNLAQGWSQISQGGIHHLDFVYILAH